MFAFFFSRHHYRCKRMHLLKFFFLQSQGVQRSQCPQKNEIFSELIKVPFSRCYLFFLGKWNQSILMNLIVSHFSLAVTVVLVFSWVWLCSYVRRARTWWKIYFYRKYAHEDFKEPHTREVIGLQIYHSDHCSMRVCIVITSVKCFDEWHW